MDHTVVSNSDVNVFFLEILPQLNNKIIIGIHDIFLPRDYPPAVDRYYNEQYMLSMLLLYGNVEIVFSCKLLLINIKTFVKIL